MLGSTDLMSFEVLTYTTMPTLNIDESDASMRQRLVNSLSQSFPGSALSKALQCMNDSDDDLKDPLSSSCFAELCMKKEDPDDEDDELTSLAWLQDSNLLKDINAGEEEDEDMKENGDIIKSEFPQTHPCHVPYNPHKHVNSKPPYSFSCLIFMAIEDSPQKKLPVKDIYQWILSHFPYFQNAPTGWKNSVRHNLSLNKCFKKVDKDRGQSIGKGSLWCVDPDYRPNLLQALRKTPYHPYHQLQMLSSPPPSQQYHYIQGIKPLQPLAPRFGPNTISPHLFPFLSRRLGQPSFDIDSDIKDVAQTLVSLKSWSKSKAENNHFEQGFKRKFGQLTFPHKRKTTSGVICTANPSDDHTYSITRVEADEDEYVPGSPGSSIDDEYDFGSDEDIDEDDISENEMGNKMGDNLDSEGESGVDEVDGCAVGVDGCPQYERTLKRPRLDHSLRRFAESSEEEKKKLEEGADALLNLAGICLSRAPMRTASPDSNSSSASS